MMVTNLIFDWNGTIARQKLADDTKEKVRKSLDTLFKKSWGSLETLNVEPWVSEIQKEIFNKMPDMMNPDKLLSQKKTGSLFYHTARSILFKRYYSSIVEELRNQVVYPFMCILLEELSKDKDYRLFLVSKMWEETLYKSLDSLDMAKYFGSRIYADSFDHKYSKLTLVRKALKDIDPKEPKCIIDDKRVGGRIAKKINGFWIYPTWGKKGSKYIKIAGHHVDTVDELFEFINSLKNFNNNSLSKF